MTRLNFISDIIWMSVVAKGKLHLILRLEVSQLSKPRVSDFGTGIISVKLDRRYLPNMNLFLKSSIGAMCQSWKF